MIIRLSMVAIVAFASGCASITGTTNQSVSIQTLEQGGKEVPGVLCEMSNSKGKWFITTPGSSMVTRSNDDMQVVCKKDGLEPGRASVVSATKGSMFGNIILGGGIGAIIDHNSGAAYEYPSFFQILMGTTTRIEPPPDNAGQAQATSSTPPAPGAPPPTASGAQPVHAIVTPATPTPAAVPVSQKISIEDKLKELKRLHDDGLIDTNVYLEQQRKLMDSKTN